MTLRQLSQLSASQQMLQVHIVPGKAPLGRTNGELKELVSEPLTKDNVESLIKEIRPGAFDAHSGRVIPFKQVVALGDESVMVAAFESGLSGLAMIVAPLRFDVPEFTELIQPNDQKVFERVLGAKFGLAVLAGSHGSGKWTLCSSLVDAINQRQGKRIFVIESNAFYRWKSKAGLLTHLMVGSDCADYLEALDIADHAAADVIAIDDVTNQAVFAKVLQHAESGRLVITNLQAHDVIDAVRRLVEFTRPEGSVAREVLSRMLLAVTSQFLVPGKEGGRQAAFEWLVPDPAVRSSILSGDLPTLRDLLATPSGRTVDTSITHLIESEKITRETAVAVLFGN